MFRLQGSLCLRCGKDLHSIRCKIVNLMSAWSAKHCCTQNISLCKINKRWRLSLGSGFELHIDSKYFQKTYIAVWRHSLWVLRKVAVYDYSVSCQIKDHWHSHNQRCQEQVILLCSSLDSNCLATGKGFFMDEKSPESSIPMQAVCNWCCTNLQPCVSHFSTSSLNS